MPVQLKGGFTATDPRLGRIPEFDETSRRFGVAGLFAEALPLPRSYSWKCDCWLNQGNDGTCVGHGFSHEFAARPKQLAADHALALRVYHRAQQLDEWPGEAYDGTSVLAGAKAATEFGYYSEYRWAFSLQEALAALTRHGPIVIGINWYEDMFDPDSNGYVHVSGDVAGGHCILVRGARIAWQAGADRTSFDQIDISASSVELHNSWGQSWGRNGRARLSLTDFDRLRKEDGEVCLPITRTAPVAA